MRAFVVLLILLFLAALGAAGATANAGPDDHAGQQAQNQTQTRTEDRLQNQTQEQLNGTGQPREMAQEQVRQEERIQNRSRTMNLSEFRRQLQERQQAQQQEQSGLPAEERRVVARYSNVSAFVHLLLNESQNRALFGGEERGIGPQVAAYAREFNNSLQAQIRAEERIESRNAFVRFFAGGDAEAAGMLEQEAIRNQERIRQMEQLIAQCQDCDAQVREMLREQLQEMEEEQTRLRQMAERERQDRGLLGWLWR